MKINTCSRSASIYAEVFWPQTVEQVLAEAKKAGCTPSEYIRDCVNDTWPHGEKSFIEDNFRAVCFECGVTP